MTDFAGHLLAQAAPPTSHGFRLWVAKACDMPQYIERYNLRTIGYWGMTETVSAGIVGNPTGSNQPEAIGKCARETELLIVDSSGRTVRCGESGELLIRRQ